MTTVGGARSLGVSRRTNESRRRHRGHRDLTSGTSRRTESWRCDLRVFKTA
jgi:hypothetical protein